MSVGDRQRSGQPPSAETWFGEVGELRETNDPTLPSWGRYNTLLTTTDRLLAFDHSALRLSRREPDGWRRVSAMSPAKRMDFDDRYLNVAWFGDSLWLLQSRGALAAWRPGGRPVELAPPSGARQPGPGYSQRTAVGWDPVGGRMVVGSGDCGRATHVAEGGVWRKLTDGPGFPAGERAAMATTPAGLYALGDGAQRRLVGDAWDTVGEGLAGARWLGLEPTRGALTR